MAMQHIDLVGRGELEEFLPVGNHCKQWRHLGERVVLTGEMCPGAAPGVLARIANQVRGHRVHFKVPRRCQQILLVHGKRGEPFLPEMPPPLFAAIDAPGIPSMGLADGAGKTFRAGGYGTMRWTWFGIRHQAQMATL